MDQEAEERHRTMINPSYARMKVLALRPLELPKDISLAIESHIIPKVTVAVILCNFDFWIAYNFTTPTDFIDASNILKEWVSTNKFEPGNPVYEKYKARYGLDVLEEDPDLKGKLYKDLLYPDLPLKYYLPKIKRSALGTGYIYVNPGPVIKREYSVELDVPPYIEELYKNVEVGIYKDPSSRRSSIDF